MNKKIIVEDCERELCELLSDAIYIDIEVIAPSMFNRMSVNCTHEPEINNGVDLDSNNYFEINISEGEGGTPLECGLMLQNIRQIAVNDNISKSRGRYKYFDVECGTEVNGVKWIYSVCIRAYYDYEAIQDMLE